jgi:hypothetical protein
LLDKLANGEHLSFFLADKDEALVNGFCGCSSVKRVE